VIELAGTSDKSIEDAVAMAVGRADKKEPQLVRSRADRGHIEDGKIAHFQVTLKAGFTMEEPS